ncbi:MAG: prepilin-type N-terminal cleavage/methylation domain-containing protein [Pirellulaceae bacterium]|nr:prepilin-type N-terminal cleavage/methylation domain-containing protein [Pirellulaceae bacterium]
MKRRGLTLLELVVVLVILVALASLAVPLVGGLAEDSRHDVTRQSLIEIRNVIVNMYWDDMVDVVRGKVLPRPGAAGLSAGRPDHPQLRYLFVNPNSEDTIRDFDPAYRRGWRGPYLMNTGVKFVALNASYIEEYGLADDPAVLDAWGNSIVIQNPGGTYDVRLVSAGPDGTLNIPHNKATVALDDADKGDDVWIAFEVR